MKLNEKMRNLLRQFKSYFVSDQMFVLFLDDFFPSENIFGLFGFSFISRLHNAEDQQVITRKKKIFWALIVIAVFSVSLLAINFVITVGNLEKLIESIKAFGFLGGYTFDLLRSSYLCYWKRDKIKKIIERLEQHFPHSSREQLKFGVQKHQRNLKILYRMCLYIYVFVWADLLGVALFSFISELFGLGLMKVELLCPVYFPLDPYQPLLYPFFFIIQASTTLVLAMTLAAADVLYCGLVCVTSVEFDVLAQKVAQINPENDENAEKKLQEIVDGYNELSDIANELEEIFSPILLTNVFSSIAMLCACVFLLFTPIESSLMAKYTPSLPGMTVQLFCTCYYGQLLQTTSLRVADEAYNSIWYGKNLKFRKMILLTMLRAQKPQILTGWKFMTIGLPVFYSVLTTIHSYYSFLSGLYQQ